MERIKRFKWSILIVILHLGLVLYFNTVLGPEELIPRQWNHRGEIGSYMARDMGLWFLWGLNALIVTLFVLFPWFSARYQKNPQRFDSILPTLTFTVSFFMFIIHTYTLLWAANVEIVQRDNFMFLLIGVFFIFLGNLLPKIPSNFFAGVRTPWTLSSDKNWHRTHRVSGYVFVIGGILMAIRGLVEMGPTISLIHTWGLIGFLLVYPILYSYLFFLRERRDKGGEER